MKFVCDRCQTRYSIADEKVRQKILKIRCKTCENVITVRDGVAGVEPASAIAGAAIETSNVAFGAPRPSASIPVILPPSAPLPGAGAVEWFLALNGAQTGPFTRADLARRVLNAKPQDEVYVWKEDFDGWKEPKDVPAVAQEIATLRGRSTIPPTARAITPPSPPRAASPLASTPARPSGTTPAVGAGRTTGSVPTRPSSSLPAARTTGASMPVATGRSTGSALPVATGRSTGSALPVASPVGPGAAFGDDEERTQISPLSAAALAGDFGKPAAAPAPAPRSGPFAALADPVPTAGSGGGVGSAPGVAPLASPLADHAQAVLQSDAVLPSDVVLQGGARRRKLKMASAGAIALGGLAVAGWAMLGGSGDDKPSRPLVVSSPRAASAASLDEVEKKARAEAERRFAGTVVAEPAQEKKPTTAAPAKHRADPPKKVAGRSSRGTNSPSLAPPALEPGSPGTGLAATAGLTPDQEATLRRMEREERKVALGTGRSQSRGSGASVPEGQVSSVIGRRENQAAIKACYERALKRDNRLRSGNIEVTLSIGTSGRVTHVAIAGASEFVGVESCVKTAIRRWLFPSSSEEYATAFKFVFQGS